MISPLNVQEELNQNVNDFAAGTPQCDNAACIYVASFLADNAFEFYRQIVNYLAKVTGLPLELCSGLSPDEQDRRVDAGEIQAVFTCGLPYVRKADLYPPLLSLIAAPVMMGARYCDRPVYFSDVIVPASSPYQTFEDLRDSVFAYNEVYSLSGYMLARYHLMSLGETENFFGKMIKSGSHSASMDWVEQGKVDAAAIDSVSLEMELAQHPERVWSWRVIENMGPTTMPPFAASRGLPGNLLRRLRQVLLEMPTTEQGRDILGKAGVRRFAPVVDADYDPIRRIIDALPG